VFEECLYQDRALYLPNERTLVLADVHLGRDQASDVSFPLGEKTDIVERLGSLLAQFEPREVVVAGDLLHSFDRLPHGVERSLREFERRIEERGARLVVTRGNHDTLLDSVLDGAVCEHSIGGLLICHGHERPSQAAGYIIGHVHPAIRIEGQKRPCYLRGLTTNEKEVLVLPAFTRLAAGVDIGRSGALRSPLLTHSFEYRPIVRDESSDKTLEFPPLGEFRSLL
jgi:putative SbcD/Mre11-related phosphoesterase